KGAALETARWAAKSSRGTPLDWVTRTSSSDPSPRIVNWTVIGCVKFALTCCIQVVQTFRWTAARYQSPIMSVPSGTPGPGGPNSKPGVSTRVPVPACAPAAGEAECSPVVGVYRDGGGLSGRAFARRASGSGRPLRGSSFGGLMTLGGGSGFGAGGASADGAGSGAVAAGAAGSGLGRPKPPGGSGTTKPSMTFSAGSRGASSTAPKAPPTSI